MTKPLYLSRHLHLSAEAVTQTFGILGKRGSGKTTTASVFAEELLKSNFPLVIIDPTDAWWGLRSSRDGKSDGYPITILGGDHGDAPLEEAAGKVIADLVAEEAPPLVLSLCALSKSSGRRFACDFFERLYEKNRTALMVIIDECDEFAPQRIQKGSERLFGAVDTVVRRGRLRGLGVTMISQRSAAINKDILSQCEVLIAHRANHPRDIDPILEWMQVHASKDQIAKVHATIAQLANGEAWVMSPEWLDLFGRVQMRDRETFNSSATPKAGERRIVPKRLAAVDLRALQTRMAETIEKAKAADPALLRRRISELEAKARQALSAIQTKVEKVEVPVIKTEDLGRLEKLVSKVDAMRDGMAQAQQVLVTEIWTLREAVLSRCKQRPALGGVHQAEPKQRLYSVRSKTTDGGEIGNGGLRRMLIALAQRPNGLTTKQLGIRAGLSSRSGTFSNYLSRARSNGWIDGFELLKITEDGISALGGFDPLPEGPELAAFWLRELGDSGAARMLRVLCDAYPGSLSTETLGERAQISHRSGTFSNYLSRLRGLELVTGRGEIRASEELAP